MSHTQGPRGRVNGSVRMLVSGLLVGALGAGPQEQADRSRVWSYLLIEGTMTFHFDAETLATLGFSFVPQGALATNPEGTSFVFEIDPSASPAIEFAGTTFEGLSGGPAISCGALLLDRPGARMVIGNLGLCADDSGVLGIESTLDRSAGLVRTMELVDMLVELDRIQRRLTVEAELVLTASWAATLDIPNAAGTRLGAMVIEALVDKGRTFGPVPSGACEPVDDPDGVGAIAAEGSDVVVANLQSIVRYPPVGDITPFAVGTTACNMGTQRASWVASTNQHPVILQNVYRLSEDRFEQIGMSWVKHGFYAVSESYCTFCYDITSGSQLGVGCSDPYSAHLNGVQTNMSPRSTVNAHTGEFPFPWSGPAPQDTMERRIQVRAADLDPALNPAARYYIEGHYVLPDDCRAGTQDNNASYREVRASATQPGVFNLVINSSWPTQRGKAAVRAWQDADPSVVETDVRVPGEGLFILAAKARPLGDGLWRYSYALQNLNSDRSARAFSVPLPDGAAVTHVGFHDVTHHSGEPYDPNPWTVAINSDSVIWATDAYAVNPNANALRYDAIYNFFFDTNVDPSTAKISIGLFKPGFPQEITASTLVPRRFFVDCNHNGTPDGCDLDCGVLGCLAPCGESTDCDADLVPDECEPDCNDNAVADTCDIRDCAEGDWLCRDCNQNLVPDGCEPDCDHDGLIDECETITDADADGVSDCDDLCPETTPLDACLPPIHRLVVCCFENGLYFENTFTWGQCLASAGVPVCDSVPMCPGTPCPQSACRNGCLVGDFEGDGDIDLHDFADLQCCFSGSTTPPGYPGTYGDCTIPFDFDEDGDVDMQDFGSFRDRCFGPGQ